MKKMRYTKDRKFNILHSEKYKGYRILIISLGNHPCGYIGVVKENELYEVDSNELDDLGYYGFVNGGFTYSSFGVDKLYKKLWFFGWDYAHCDDYCNYGSFKNEGKRWTTEEILREAKRQVRKFEKLDLSALQKTTQTEESK